MPPLLALLLCFVVIAVLFVLDRNKEMRTSKALWIPVAWLFLNCSRPASQWLAGFGFVSSVQGADLATSYIEGSPIDAAVLLLRLFAGYMVLASRNQRLGPLLRKMGPIALFYFYCALSITWSDYPFVAFKHWIKGVGDVVMVLIVLTDLCPASALKRLFSRVGLILIPLSIVFIKYFPGLGRTFSKGGIIEYTGVTTQKNTLGVTCLVFGLGALWYFVDLYRNRETPRRRQLLLVHGSILAMVLWLLWTCDSKTSLTCLVMGGVAMVVVSMPTIIRKRFIAHILAATTLGISLFAVFFQSSGDLLKSIGRDSTLTGRTAIWDAVLALAGNPYIGTGYESFWLGDRLQKFWTVNDGDFFGLNEAHNGYLEVYLNLGWIGIGLLAVLIITGYKKILYTLDRDTLAGSLGLAFFISEICYNLTEAGFRMMYPIWIFFLLAIIGVPKTADARIVVPLNDDPLSNNVEFVPKLKSVKGFELRRKYR